MAGLKEGVATLACAIVVALLVVAGDSSGYTGFGQVELAQAQVHAHAQGARAVQRAVAARAPRVSGEDKAALKAAVSQKMAALARKDTLQLQAPAGLLAEHIAEHAGRGAAQKQAAQPRAGLGGGIGGHGGIKAADGGHKKKRAKSLGLTAIDRLKASLNAGEAHERLEHAENTRQGFERKSGPRHFHAEGAASAKSSSEHGGEVRASSRRRHVSNPVKFQASGRGVRKTV
eukprot:CAMPEP_0180374714 /NCGR_PEP_ID=MMETSP0989-20121125/22170_1 /TAXON_ID=697907 /ORGANISM="non described non described, Strain CCMP2293" /LENGTH=230 /DNA_ID=CAMNT_0022372163 /DNA_START=65 /DNA_END=753 /DNA_ORIENTATION=+